MVNIGDRIYATEEINYAWADPDGYVIRPGEQGVVTEVRSPARWTDTLIEWDAGFVGAVDSGSVAAL